jgi:hypothetical protein
MDHTQATGGYAAERYALGQMSEPERDRFEEHFFDCPECAEEVKAAATFLEDVEAVAREDVPAEPNYRWPTPPEPSPWWHSWKAAFWPMPVGAAASLALLLGGPAVYMASVTVPRLEKRVAADQALRLAPGYFLSVSRSARPVVSVQEHERIVVLTLSRSSDRSFPFYRFTVEDASGQSVLSSVVPSPPEQDEMQILLDTERLQPGSYVLAVAGLESASAAKATPSAEYHFTFQRAGRTE